MVANNFKQGILKLQEDIFFEKRLKTLECGTLIFGSIGSVVFSPVIAFGFAYLGGMVLNWIVGETLVNGLNLMFDTTRFSRELVPLTCATLATIGKYFKSSQSNTTKNN